MLQVRNLRKRFGEIVAVDDVSFEIKPGETLGLLGPNGAGKTTTVSMIAGLLKPDAGAVLLQGAPFRSDTDPAKRTIGLVPQDLAIYDELSAHANLHLFGSLYDLDSTALEFAIRYALELVGLSERGHDRVGTFSGGMKRRLNLAAGLLHDPKLLILDEPTVGVDPQSRNAIFENLETLRAQGKSLLYTTHYMEEAERLCDRIVIMDRGKVVADDNLRGLYRRLPAANRLNIDLDGATAGPWIDAVRQINGVAAATFETGVLTVDLEDLGKAAPRILACLAENDLAVSHVASERPNLETVFLTLTGRSLRDP